MVAQIPDALNGPRNIRIEISSAQRRFAVFVVAAGPKGQRSSTCHKPLEIVDKRAPDAPPTMGSADNKRRGLTGRMLKAFLDLVWLTV
jgi:hypothetical protein